MKTQILPLISETGGPEPPKQSQPLFCTYRPCVKISYEVDGCTKMYWKAYVKGIWGM